MRRQRGFGYLILLFALATMGLLLAGFGQSWRLSSQREKEAELITIGREFSAALASYARLSPAGQPTAPTTLTELVEDKRFPMPVRHLRRLYRDPFTGQPDWTVLQSDGRIAGVHSRSDKTALRNANLPEWIKMPGETLGEPRYSDWIFIAYTAQKAAKPGEAPNDSPDSPADQQR